MAVKLLSSDLDELKKACLAIEEVEQNISFLQDGDTEALQVLSPRGEDHNYFFDANKLYDFDDQSHASRAFMDCDWQPPVQSAVSFQKDCKPDMYSYEEDCKPDKYSYEDCKPDKCSYEEDCKPDKYNYEEDSAHFEGEDLQPICIEPNWLHHLSIDARVPNISLNDLGIRIISQKPPEDIFSNQPNSEFIPRKVSYTKEEGLLEFLRQLEPSSHTQGCLLKEELSAGEGQYTEGERLIDIKSMHQGAYGKVDRGQNIVSGYEFIRKKIPLGKFRRTEVSFPLAIKHPNIMKICGLIQRVEVDGGNAMEILMDNAGVSLAEFVMNPPGSEMLSQMLIWNLTKQALEGLSALHQEMIIHLDIKPENLCVRENMGSYVLTITDFGSAMKVNQEMDFVGWTPEYLAPESCRCYLQHFINGIFSNMNNQITDKVDVFALGLTVLFLHQKKHVLLNLLTEGQNSYNGLPMEMKKKMQLHLLFYLASQEDPVGHLISDGCSTDMRDLLSRMLSGSADMRPTAKEALSYMTVREQELDQTLTQPVATKPDVCVTKRRNNRSKHNLCNPQFTTDKGQLVTQPSSSDHTINTIEVPDSQLSLPKSINSLPDNEPGPIKDRMLKQRLREKLNPYLKTKIWVPKEIEVGNAILTDVKSSGSACTRPTALVSMATNKMENFMPEMGHILDNTTQTEDLGIIFHNQFPDTKYVQPSSRADRSDNVVLRGNIPNFDALVNI